jgi:hypothetical protein
MEEGGISGIGTHDVLMATNSQYSDLINSFENDRLRSHHD